MTRFLGSVAASQIMFCVLLWRGGEWRHWQHTVLCYEGLLPHYNSQPTLIKTENLLSQHNVTPSHWHNIASHRIKCRYLLIISNLCRYLYEICLYDYNLPINNICKCVMYSIHVNNKTNISTNLQLTLEYLHPCMPGSVSEYCCSCMPGVWSKRNSIPKNFPDDLQLILHRSKNLHYVIITHSPWWWWSFIFAAHWSEY